MLIIYTKNNLGGQGNLLGVKIKFEPRQILEKDIEFINKIKGGNIPTEFIPGVQKGLIFQQMQTGVMAGFPCIDFKATLYDGSLS